MKNKKLEKFDIVFENCEVMTVQGDDVIFINVYNDYIVEFGLHKDTKLEEDEYTDFFGTTIERFALRDVTQLYFHYSDSNEKIYVKWPYDETGNSTIHPGQQYLITPCGHHLFRSSLGEGTIFTDEETVDFMVKSDKMYNTGL